MPLQPGHCQTIPPSMCGRYTQTSDASKLQQRFRAFTVKEPIVAGYNIGPTQPVAVLADEEGQKVIGLARWGLVPAWSKGLGGAPHPINARAETVATSNLFRRLLTHRRCLVLADGFYEWEGGKGRKLPTRFVLRSREPFAFAGLWDEWKDPQRPEAPALRTCTIVTVPANELVATIHDRMPAMLRPEQEDLWLDPAVREPVRLLAPYDAGQMEAYRVSQLVNDLRMQGPECLAPLPAAG